MTTPTRRDVLAATAFAAVPALVMRGPAHGAPQTIRLKLGNDLPAAHPVNKRLVEAIAAIHAETSGAVSIELFPNNQLGGDPSMLSQIRSGALEFATFPGTVLSTLIPQMAIPGVGFAYPSYEKVWASMDGGLGDYLRAKVRDAGLFPVGPVWDNGFRQITASTRPILSPVDLRNFKIRVPVVPLWVAMFKSLGAAPVSIPLAEAYSSLQTKIADGQENPLSLINLAKFYEVQKYCTLTNHAWDGFWFVANPRVWAALPGDIQALLAKHFAAAALKEREDIAALNVHLRKDLEAKGLAFAEADRPAFQGALSASGFYERAKAKYGADAWGQLTAYSGSLS